MRSRPNGRDAVATALFVGLFGVVAASCSDDRRKLFPLPGPPPSPSGLTASPASPCRVDLTWVDNSSTESGFSIERSPQGTQTFLPLGTAPTDATAFTDTTATPAVAFDYRVRATSALGSSQPSAVISATTPPNGLPVVTPGFGAGIDAYVGQDLRFTVTATDPDGDVVTLRLVNPPPGCTATPAIGPAPVSLAIRWLIPPLTSGSHPLTFEARDCERSAPLVVTVRVGGTGEPSATQIGDVNGDGLLDVVAGASGADVAGVADVGALYVWEGSRIPAGSPRATLVVPGAVAGDRLGNVTTGGQAIQLVDVTGDGVLDVIAGASAADVAGVTDAGAIYVWRGGALEGSVAPLATLVIPGAVALDNLGSVGSGQGIQLVDVTGDGVPDVVAGAFQRNSGATNAGAIYVWAGGGTLTGTPAPTAILQVAGAAADDQLGFAQGQGIQLVDVTGDGTRDVVAGAVLADVGGTTDVGAVYVWAGGGALTGTPAPQSTLGVAGAAAFDRLGDGGLGALAQGIQFADVSDDGVLDVVVAARGADQGLTGDVGKIYVWEGAAALTAAPAPLATLGVPGAVVFDQLTGTFGRGLYLADVTGDTVADVIAGSKFADVGGTADTGAVYVWAGGATLIGNLAPDATLAIAGAATGDQLGLAEGEAVLLADVTDNGTLDVVVGAQFADVGANDTGAVYVWEGGAAAGMNARLATLTVPGASAGDQLGNASGQAIQLVDVTNDGVPDVVVGAQLAGATDTGAITVWAGGFAVPGAPALLATLTVPGAAASDRLGNATGQGIQLADVSGDGVADLIVGAELANPGGTLDAGAIFVWAGGASLIGAPATLATLTATGASAGDLLGDAAGQGIQVAEVTGDGVLDVVAGARLANDGAAVDAGALYVWEGGASLSGAAAQLARLARSSPFANDQLGGVAAGPGVQVADLTGDGTPDLALGAAAADVAGINDAGAVLVWEGGAAASAVLQTLSVAGATIADSLGE